MILNLKSKFEIFGINGITSITVIVGRDIWIFLWNHSISSLMILHFDSNTSLEGFDLISSFLVLVAAENPDEDGHEEEEDSGGDHGFSEITSEIGEVIDEWS